MEEDGTIQEAAPSCSVLGAAVDSRAAWLHHKVGAGELLLASLALAVLHSIALYHLSRFAEHPDLRLIFLEGFWLHGRSSESVLDEPNEPPHSSPTGQHSLAVPKRRSRISRKPNIVST